MSDVPIGSNGSNGSKPSENDLPFAIYKQQRLYSEALDRLRELASNEAENEVYDLTFLLKESVELVGCLRRLVAERTPDEIHRAFGAPGDFGYETPIGDALARVYGLFKEPMPEEPKR